MTTVILRLKRKTFSFKMFKDQVASCKLLRMLKEVGIKCRDRRVFWSLFKEEVMVVKYGAYEENISSSVR